MRGLMNAKQAAARLGISERKLWELTNRGDVTCVRIDRRVLYDPVDVDDFIAKQKSKRRVNHAQR